MPEDLKDISDPAVAPLIEAVARAQVAWENAIVAVVGATGVDPLIIAQGVSLGLFSTTLILGEQAVQTAFGERAEATDQEVDSK